ncbi:hypothetical protein PtB15_7B147 [Puccinia triticina]|nr:hypothetical protein PtB15_7B147 [Puccinia triticina]
MLSNSNTLRFTTLLVCSLLVFTPATIGQDFKGLPPCAGNCLATALASSGKTCTPTDFACLCKNQDFISTSDSCYSTSCTVNDLKDAKAWGVKTCAAAGVQLAANGVNAAANGITNAANSATNALTGNSTAAAGHSTPGNPNNSTGPGTTTGNTAPVNTNNPPAARPNSAVALSAEMVKFFAIGSAIFSSLLMI